MSNMIGYIETSVSTVNGKPILEAYVQVWKRREDGTGDKDAGITNRTFSNLTPEKWLRFRRIQETLATS